jgi:hypothetical protein
VAGAQVLAQGWDSGHGRPFVRRPCERDGHEERALCNVINRQPGLQRAGLLPGQQPMSLRGTGLSRKRGLTGARAHRRGTGWRRRG